MSPPIADGARLCSPTLIGRDRELTLLRDAAAHPPALVLVEGGAGIGKSRLVRDVVSRLEVEGSRVLIGHCHRVQDPFLLGPIVDALRQANDEPRSRPLSPVVGALRPLLPELAGMLPAELAPIGDVRAGRHRVFRALRELLDALGPTICALEDLHWADEGTLEFLAFLLSEPPAGLTLVITYRGEDLRASSPLRTLAPHPCEEMLNLTIELSALSATDVRQLVSAILNADVSERFARDLHSRTSGNPLAIEEVIRMLRDQDQLVLDSGRVTGALPRVAVPRRSGRRFGSAWGHLPATADSSLTPPPCSGCQRTTTS